MPHVGKGNNLTDNASNWIAFEPAEAKPRQKQGYGKDSDAKRKRVRAAAAASSAATRLATMKRKRRRDDGSSLSRLGSQAPRTAATTERKWSPILKDGYHPRLTCPSTSTQEYVYGWESLRNALVDAIDNEPRSSCCGDVPGFYRSAAFFTMPFFSYFLTKSFRPMF